MSRMIINNGQKVRIAMNGGHNKWTPNIDMNQIKRVCTKRRTWRKRQF